MTEDRGPDPIRTAVSREECAAALAALLRSRPDPPRWLAALYEAATTYHRLGALAEAEGTLRLILSDGGDIIDKGGGPTLRQASQFMLGGLLLKQGRLLESASNYTSAAQAFLDRDSPLDAAQLVASVVAEFRVADAEAIAPLLAVATAAAELAMPGPELITALTTIGYGAYLCGDPHGAAEFQERALRLATHSRDDEAVGPLLENVITLGYESGDLRRVARHARRVADYLRDKESPNRDGLLSRAAYACAEVGHSEDALALLDELETRSLDPGAKTTLHTLRAEALLDLKQYEAAARVLANIQGKRTPAIVSLQNRLASETSSPLKLDCAHRVLAMAVGQGGSDASHSNDIPRGVIEPEAYRQPGLVEADRTRFDKLWEELQQPHMKVTWGQSHTDAPESFMLPIRIEYTADVAEFEQSWRSYEHERGVRALRGHLRDHWSDLCRRLPHGAGARIDNPLIYLDTVETICSIARALASAGELEAFRPVAFYAADLLEATSSDPVLAALAWTERARLMDAARILAGPNLPLLPVELARSLERFSGLASSLDADRCRAIVESTIGNWVEMAADGDGAIDCAVIVDLATPVAGLLGPEARLQLGVACSLAGRHRDALTMIESTLEAAHETNKNARITYPESVGTALALARFLTSCNDTESCLAAYGVFAAPLQSEVAAWNADVFRFGAVAEGLTVCAAPPLAFADERFIVLRDDLDGWSYSATVVHEISHLQRRTGQMLRTADGEWRSVKRDVPIASAITYLYAHKGRDLVGEEAASEVKGLEGLRELIAIGQEAARHDPSEAGRHIANMLAYFDALGEQESPASYACAALLAGMSCGLVGEAGAEGALSYLEHLAVADHKEALGFGRRRASLQL